MKKSILNIEGVNAISKEAQRQINGGAGWPSKCTGCGCDCAGNVTGPLCCHITIACPQVYTCGSDI